MNRDFFLRSGEKVDPIEHTLGIVRQFPKKWDDLRIHVGADSQNKRYSTQYVGTICYRYPGGRGAHFIYCTENVKKIKDINAKLRGEVELSMEIAIALQDAGVKIHCIDFDFNANDLRRSNEVVAYAKGWALGMGFDCTVKPQFQLASRASDNIVKGKKERRWHGKNKSRKQEKLIP